MQKFLFISNNGESLPIVWRMLQEGTDVSIYVHNPKARAKNYKGILPRLGIDQLYTMVKREKNLRIIFDLTHPNDKTPWDRQLMEDFAIPTTANAVFGPLAEKLRAMGHDVVGCSKWSEDIELDRMLGAQIARQIGLSLPPSVEFPNLKEGLKFLESNEAAGKLWVLKPFNNQDLDLTYVEGFEGELKEKFKNELPKRVQESTFHHMLQEVVEGTEISTEVWFDGTELLSHNRTVEGKKFLCGNLGMQIGSQSNTIWLAANTQGVILREMEGLIPFMRRARYVGPIDANCIIAKKDGKPYFLEWSARIGYDAIYCLLSLLPENNITSFFSSFDIPSPRAKYASSARISIPPFPGRDKKVIREMAADVPIAHGLCDKEIKDFWMEDIYCDTQAETLRCAGRDGIIGVQTGVGETVEESCDAVLKAAKKLRIGASKQYRIDMKDRPLKVLSEHKELM